MNKKLGFFSVIAITIGSQLGTGALLLPSVLAPYGKYGIYGLILACCVALSISYVFSLLSISFPEAEGPHIYIKHILGDLPAKITCWLYWVASWVSNVVVVVMAVENLAVVFPILNNPFCICISEISMLFVFTILNLRGTKTAGIIEVMLTTLKILPFIIIPLLAVKYYNVHYFETPIVKNLHIFNVLDKIVILAFWGFIGLETATTVSRVVKNPQIIPLANMIGTGIVSVTYFVNCFYIMGMFDSVHLANTSIPYVDVINKIFGHGYGKLVSFFSFIICAGTLNSWILAGGQMAYGGSLKNLLPASFKQINRQGSPYVPILISFFLSVPIFLIILNKSISDKALYIINLTVIVFLVVYFLSCFALCKFIIANAKWSKSKKIINIILSGFASLICLLIIARSCF